MQALATLLAWGEGRRANLPWRATRDPWAVLVSETMLQQTQVSRVEPRYRAFLDTFPTATVCADASVAAVIRLWDGLGYNRRARNLHRAAVLVAERHGGRVPDDLDALLALPGVGPYTARAVLSFAFERDVGVVDTNIGRVLARCVVGEPLSPAAAQRLADDLVPPGRSRAWNLALMDLGAEVCRKRDPRCGSCPVAQDCAWRRAGRREPDPAATSAGVSRPQARFEGSDRQGRGRLVTALRRRPVPLVEVPRVVEWPHDPDRARRVVDALADEGLVEVLDGIVRLPRA